MMIADTDEQAIPGKRRSDAKPRMQLTGSTSHRQPGQPNSRRSTRRHAPLQRCSCDAHGRRRCSCAPSFVSRPSGRCARDGPGGRRRASSDWFIAGSTPSALEGLSALDLDAKLIGVAQQLGRDQCREPGHLPHPEPRRSASRRTGPSWARTSASAQRSRRPLARLRQQPGPLREPRRPRLHPHRRRRVVSAHEWVTHRYTTHGFRAAAPTGSDGRTGAVPGPRYAAPAPATAHRRRGTPPAATDQRRQRRRRRSRPRGRRPAAAAPPSPRRRADPIRTEHSPPLSACSPPERAVARVAIAAHCWPWRRHRDRGLTRTFPAGRALDTSDLRSTAGEVLALLGPNGAGKTTTVRLLNGVLRPDSGSARVLGLDPMRRRRGGAPPHRCADRERRPRRSPHRRARTSTSPPGCAATRAEGELEARRRAARAVRHGRAGRRPDPGVLDRPAQAPRARPGPAPRSRGAVPRRADVGPRPGRHPGRRRPHPVPRRRGAHDRALPPTSSARPGAWPTRWPCCTGAASRCSADPTSSPPSCGTASGAAIDLGAPARRPHARPLAGESRACVEASAAGDGVWLACPDREVLRPRRGHARRARGPRLRGRPAPADPRGRVLRDRGAGSSSARASS